MIFIKSCILDLRVMRTTSGKTVTKEELEKTIEIILTETETLRLFNLPTVMVSVESEEAEKVRYVLFNYPHCFCNLNAKTEVLLFLSLGIPGYILWCMCLVKLYVKLYMCPVKLYVFILYVFFSKGHSFTIFFKK